MALSAVAAKTSYFHSPLPKLLAMRFAFRTGAYRSSRQIPADARATLWRSLAGLLDRELLALNLFLTQQKDFGVPAFVFQLAKHLFEEVDYLPAFRWFSSFFVPFLAVVQSSQIVVLQVPLFQLEGLSQSHKSHNPFGF